MAGTGGLEPPECQSQSLVPYHLATSQTFSLLKKMVGGGRFELPNPKEQIYSLPRLATSLPSQYLEKNGAG